MPFRVGCIGAGYFSQFHYEAWHRIANATVVASVDADLGKAQATGHAAFSDASKMLAEHAPDIVDVITPPATHFEVLQAAFDHKPQVIICQKPFCETPDQTAQIIARSKETGIPVVVHENFRFQPWYRKIKSALDHGEIGDVLQLTFRLRPGDGQGADAYLDRQPYFQAMPRFLVHETAVHWIDTFRFLLGQPRRVFADLRRMNPAISGEDAGYILFDFGDGKRGLFDGNRLLDHAASNTRCTMGEALVEGTLGTLSVLGDGSVRLRKFGTTQPVELLAPTSHAGFGGDCVYHLQKHVVDALDGRGSFENTAENYNAVAAAEAAVYRSAEIGAWVDLTA
jgi:predicted dehydrogenase